MDEAHNLAGQGSYTRALQQYSSAGQCFHRNQQYGKYLLAISYELDCLEKLSEYEKLQSRISFHEREIRKYAPQLVQNELNSLRFSNTLFAALMRTKLGDIDSAIRIFQSEYDSLSQINEIDLTQSDTIRKSKLLIYLSELHLQKGDHDQAVTLAYEAIDIDPATRELLFTDGSILKPLVYLAESQFKAGSTKDAWQTVEYIQRIVNSLQVRKVERAFLVSGSVLDFHLRSGNLDSAQVYLDHLRKLDATRQHEAGILMMTGDYHMARGDPALAETAYREALSVIQKLHGVSSEELARCYLSLGNMYLRKRQFEKALMHFHHGLYGSSAIQIPDADVTKNPSFSSLYDQRNIPEMLLGKSIALQALNRHVQSGMYADAAWNTIRLAVDFMKSLRTDYSAETDKSLLIDDSYPVFEQALELAYSYYVNHKDQRWIDSAFVLMEESKALNLRDAVLHGQARRYAGIPDSLLELENTLRLEIAGKEELVRNYTSTPESLGPAELSAVRELAGKKEQYQRLLARYEREHPRYYAFKHKSIAISIEDLRASLFPGQTVLEYFVGDSAIFILRIDRKDKQLYRVQRDFPLHDWVSNYRASLQEFALHKSMLSLETYTKSAFQLAQKLIPEDARDDALLLIIPDGLLGYVSFSSLLRSQPDDLQDIRHYDYLLWHHDIAYSYSANLHLELHNTIISTTGNTLVCAPEFTNLEGIPSLEFSRQEAQAIRRITSGQLLSGMNCTIGAFTHAIRGRPLSIVHMATHGYADDNTGDASYLVFSGDTEDEALLFARDLYNYDMPFDLVYLSACETASGELRRGEGIISLARAFFYAGVKSLVTTLWRAEDRRSAQISEAFYRHLENGAPKHHALAEAQRQYIRTLSPEEKFFAHPVYWSALIPVGNMEALEMSGTSHFPWWAYLLLILGGAVMIGLVVMRMRRNKAGKILNL